MGASTALNIIARVGRVCLYTLPSANPRPPSIYAHLRAKDGVKNACRVKHHRMAGRLLPTAHCDLFRLCERSEAIQN